MEVTEDASDNDVKPPPVDDEPESSRSNDQSGELDEREAIEAYMQAQVEGSDGIVCRDTFYNTLSDYYGDRCKMRPWSIDKLKRAIADLRAFKANTGLKKTSFHYGMLRRYEVVETEGGGCHVVTIPKARTGTAEDTARRQVVAYEKIYDKLMDLHLKMGHSRRDKMSRVIRQNYLIPRVCVVNFLQLCKVCATGSAKRTEQHNQLTHKLNNDQQLQYQPVKRVKGVPSRSQSLITSSEDGFNGLGQVDVVDFQHMPDGEYKWLLRYEDLNTKFISLRPLKSDTVTEIAGKLLKVFLQFGAPLILQSSSGGHRLVSSVVTVLLKSWPTCKIVNAHRKSATVEDAQFHDMADSLETFLRAWMHEYSSANWAKGCYFVQWRKNTALRQDIGKTPYAATFGVGPKSGLRGGPAKTIAPRLPVPPAPPVPRSPAPKVPRKRRRKGAAGSAANELETAITDIPDGYDEAEQHEMNHEAGDEVMGPYVLVLDPSEVSVMMGNPDEEEQ